jgi:UDP-galactopyranose mutase
LNPSSADLVCLSHLRWDFVYQRPNHLMARAARDRRVFFIEEPERISAPERRHATAALIASQRDGVTIVKPVVPATASDAELDAELARALPEFLAARGVQRPWLWFYTPMALPWTSHIDASAVVYDAMDELSNFRFAPTHLRERERELLRRADVVFAGGRSLWEAKRQLHPDAHLFPSSVDAAHFRRGRVAQPDPIDQHAIARPRLGYAGVIDERIDLELIDRLASARPEWQVVMLGPVVKIDPDSLPRRPNIHWLGLKPYTELPAYISGWDVAIMPFALNDATRYISPTKTPEFLAAGRPVVSTPIADVVEPYGRLGLVEIAADAEEFVAAAARALASDRRELVERADRFLAELSWDATWQQMHSIVAERARRASEPRAPRGRATQLPAYAGAQAPVRAAQ